MTESNKEVIILYPHKQISKLLFQGKLVFCGYNLELPNSVVLIFVLFLKLLKR